jgi:hypothetical protein
MTFNWNVQHFAPTILTVINGKDAVYPSFAGYKRLWYLNHGEGSYRLKDYEDDGDLTFGYEKGLIPKKHVEEWDAEEELWDNGWGPTLETREIKS